MQNTAVAAGATDVSVILRAFDTTTGAAKTDVTDATSGLELRYKRGATGSVTTVSPASQTSTGAHTDGGIVHLHGGLYRLDLPDAAFATGVPWVVVSAAGVADCVFTAAFVEIMGSDPRAAALTSPVSANVTQWSGTNVPTPATNGYPVVTLKVGTGTGELNIVGGRADASLSTPQIELIGDTVVAAEIAALDGFTASDTALTIDGVAHTITRNDTDGYVASITAD